MQAETNRYQFLDVTRGVALLAMAIYHFGWDLAFFGYVDPISVNTGPWRVFARFIASSFLVLVGISLVLAHNSGIRWHGFWRRWLKITVAALIITIATYFATPDAFIFFGILHQIAFASLFGLLFLRLSWFVLLATGLVWIISAPYLATPFLDDMYMAWSGLQDQSVRSNDYVPVFPWFGAVLIGMGLAKLMLGTNTLARVDASDRFSTTAIGRCFSFFGRHSLATYLLHQPILIGLIYLYTIAIGP